ncbi:hypothetical protein Tco_1187896, partial [Tanacetum coccineum]
IPPPVYYRDDIPDSEMPLRKRLCLSTPGSRDTWVDPAELVPEIAHVTLGEVNTRVAEISELHERDTQDLYALLEDAQDSRCLAQIAETLRVMRDMRREMSDMQDELLAQRVQQSAKQPRPDARIPDHQDASGDADSHV